MAFATAIAMIRTVLKNSCSCHCWLLHVAAASDVPDDIGLSLAVYSRAPLPHPSSALDGAHLQLSFLLSILFLLLPPPPFFFSSSSSFLPRIPWEYEVRSPGRTQIGGGGGHELEKTSMVLEYI